MPNKYSHAFVVSNYEYRGAIDPNQRRHPKSPSSQSPIASVRSQNPNISTSHNLYNGTKFKQSSPSEHLRLGTSPPSPKSLPRRPSIRSRSSSIETQIYAPLSSPTLRPNGSRRDGYTSETHNQSTAKSQSPPIPNTWGSPRPQTSSPAREYIVDEPPLKPPRQSPRVIRYQKHNEQLYQDDKTSNNVDRQPPRSPAVSQASTPPRDFRQVSKSILLHSSSIASGERQNNSPNLSIVSPAPKKHHRTSQQLENSMRPLQNPYSRVPLSANVLAPECPPSPPDTPSSSRSFSLAMSMRQHDPMPLPPQVPERNPNRSSPHPLLDRSKSNQRSTSSTSKDRQPENRAIFTTVSSATQTSPDQSPQVSATSSNALSTPSEAFSRNDTDLSSPHTATEAPSLPFAEDDADLESLPSTLDFNAMPWCDHETYPPSNPPTSSLHSHHQSISSFALTRASSFDSAAPPPIALHRPSHPTIFSHDKSSPLPPTTPKQKRRPSLTSLSSLPFFRPTTPKAILYSQTTPGKPPIPVAAVSRTGSTSIPALFPNYTGQFPPPSPVQPTLPSRPQTRDGALNMTSSRAASIERWRNDEKLVRPASANSNAAHDGNLFASRVVGPQLQVKDRRPPKASGGGRSALRGRGREKVEEGKRGSSVPVGEREGSRGRRRSFVEMVGLGG